MLNSIKEKQHRLSPEAAPRVDWGGRVHPTFFKNRFCDSPKFDEKMGGGGNQSFSFSS